jgi:hypothetical protein
MVGETMIELVMETRGTHHVEELKRLLSENKIDLLVPDDGNLAQV